MTSLSYDVAMPTTHRAALASLTLLLLALTPTTALADPVVAMNDSVDLAALIAGETTVSMCPCFCTYEGFAATFTAPQDMDLAYVHLVYPTFVDVETAIDVHFFEGAQPGTHFDDGGAPAIAAFIPLSSTGPEVMEIDVAAAGVVPPTVSAGDQFTIGFTYSYDDGDGVDLVVPNGGHGPAYDADGQATAGTNWVYGFDADGCGQAGDAMTWGAVTSVGFAADWLIRVSDESIDWTDPVGDDDDSTTTDDDDDDDSTTTDDDDAATDDDDGADDDDARTGGCDCSGSLVGDGPADLLALLGLLLAAPLVARRRR